MQCDGTGSVLALEYAVKDDVVYAIDITNYVCDMDYKSLKDAHFGWSVETMGNHICDLAKSKARNHPTAHWGSLRELVAR